MRTRPIGGTRHPTERMQPPASTGGPRWRYEDATGVAREGHVENIYDHGGSDITYVFKRDDGSGRVDVVSGSRLNSAEVLREGAPPALQIEHRGVYDTVHIGDGLYRVHAYVPDEEGGKRVIAQYEMVAAANHRSTSDEPPFSVVKVYGGYKPMAVIYPITPILN